MLFVSVGLICEADELFATRWDHEEGVCCEWPMLLSHYMTAQLVDECLNCGAAWQDTGRDE